MDAETIETRLLIEAIRTRYGYDFRNYAEASLRRRVRAVLLRTGFDSASHLQHALLRDEKLFELVLPELTVPTSEMFRDPLVFQAIRQHVVPILKTYPSFRIWHAGCSTGEEVYSLAILLEEEHCYDRATIYATDINPVSLKTAQDGIYRADTLRKYTGNYQAAGGKQAFSDYYTAAYGVARFDTRLRRNIVFAEHNLATDAVFAETHLVICRNVLIYFDRTLQEQVVRLFAASLRRGGFLCLGSKESLSHLDSGHEFDEVAAIERIYRRKLSHGERA